MFEHIFKRPGDKPDENPSGSSDGKDAARHEGPVSPRRAEQAERVKQLGDDEAAAADFILQCEFSELRLIAAEGIHSQAQLERVHQAIRNTDRRVAKLLQGRLDAIRHQHAEQQRAETCIAQARALLQDEKLTPNHVADLDRSWKVIAAPADLAEQFATLRAELAQRLEAQMVLQRALIDSIAAVRQLPASGLPAAELTARLEQLAGAHAAAASHPEHAAVPKHLFADFTREQAQVLALLPTLEQHQAAVEARAALLAEWEAAAAGTLDADSLQRAWRQNPGAADDAQQQRFDAVLATAPRPANAVPAQARSERPPRPPKEIKEVDPQFIATLDAMEANLQQGQLQAAADCDKKLKDAKGVRLTPAVSERLTAVRAELKRLSDWARWSGNVSREELIKAVEALPAETPSMSELAKKVGSMRERWKALDTQSGPAPKGLWERFDSACTTAYAPAAAHFKQLADERHANAAKARLLVDEAAAASASLGDAASVDWKALAATSQRLRQAWTRLGTIDRKEKRRLDTDFGKAIKALQAPLEAQRQSQLSGREQLIAEVEALNANDRHTIEAMRAIQERWQQQARALPLERKAEQAMWQRFRAACDAVFSKRKEVAHAADAERRTHQHAKEALCARLEEGAGAPADDDKARASAAAKLLREVAIEWQGIGPVPRANEARIEKRHHAAVHALQGLIDAAKRNAGMAQSNAMREKLHLCQALEAAMAGDGDGGDDWPARWSALPRVANDAERVLQARFDAGLKALSGDRAAYAARLEKNRDKLLQDVLRLEIAAGVDSGSDFARDRLKLQVEVLQASLKSGQQAGDQHAQLLCVIGSAALTDARTATRIDTLLRRVAANDRK